MVIAAEKTMNAVDRIAGYAASSRFEDLDALTLERARQTVLDTIGTTYGGYQTELGRRAAAYAATMEPGDEASIIADGRRSTVTCAELETLDDIGDLVRLAAPPSADSGALS